MNKLSKYLEAKRDAKHGFLWSILFIGVFYFLCYKAWVGMTFLWGWLPFSAWFFLILPPLPFWMGCIYAGIKNIKDYYTCLNGIPFLNGFSKLFNEIYVLLENDPETKIQDGYIELQTENNKIVIEEGFIYLLEKITGEIETKSKKKKISDGDNCWQQKERYEMNGAENKKILKLIKNRLENNGKDQKNMFLKSVLEIKEERLKKQMNDYEKVLKDIQDFQQESKDKVIQNMERVRQLQT